MGIARILRCHPLSETGDDPVPDYFSLKRKKLPWTIESMGAFLCLNFDHVFGRNRSNKG